MATVVAASPAAAAPAGNGWSCISPFATYLNSGALADDPPAPNAILNSLAIDVSRTVATPLTAVPGQPLALQDLQLSLEFRDTRVAEQMYRRTGGATSSYSQLIPYTQEANTTRTLSVRANPGDGGANYWSYTTGSGAAQVITYVQKIDFPGEPPKVRAATTPFNTTFYYATPTLGLAHRYISHTGKSDFPLDAWVTIAASNTVEGTQTIPVKGQWSIDITDATPGAPGNPANYANDAVTATIAPVVLPLKGTRWTPTGAGPVEFTVAQPGKLGIVQIESEGYDRVGYNQPLNIRPFGSVFVRAGTEAYGASNDCIPGAVSLVNSQISANQTTYFFLDADPVTPDPLLGDPAAPGTFTNQGGAQKPVGLRGRFGFAYTAPPAIATAPLPAAVPQPTVMKPATFGGSSSVKPSKTGAVKLALTNPNTTAVSYKVSAKTVGKYAVGKSKTKKVVTVASTKTVSLKAGASNVNLSLSKAAKTLLKQRKSVKVKVTLTPVSGGSAITKTITLKRS
ncbi:hypothetical protein OJ998_08990 [Solirubrobacter taibaiensis]|nr:hypothetical protein [Solirubrobacter taibaiensis]